MVAQIHAPLASIALAVGKISMNPSRIVYQQRILGYNGSAFSEINPIMRPPGE
jgi:hypothetical protein